MTDVLVLLHDTDTSHFSNADGHRLVRSSQLMFLAYMKLAEEACIQRAPRWPIKPKFHAWAHHVLTVKYSLVNPKYSCFFADEDFNAKIIQMASPSVRRGKVLHLNRRVCRLWVWRFLKSLKADRSLSFFGDL